MPDPKHTRDVYAALASALRYDPETGVFTWLRGRREGLPAGGFDAAGYLKINWKGTKVAAHRLALFIATGEVPGTEVDHLDRDKTNNRLTNLRVCSRCENNLNKGPYANNTSGTRGVYWNKDKDKWQVRVQRLGNSRSFGYYTDLRVANRIARAVYAAARTTLTLEMGESHHA